MNHDPRMTAHSIAAKCICGWGYSGGLGWLEACHDAMDHARETGHAPVSVLQTNAAFYGPAGLLRVDKPARLEVVQ